MCGVSPHFFHPTTWNVASLPRKKGSTDPDKGRKGKLVFYCLDAFDYPGLYGRRQGRIVEGSGHALPLGQSPVEKLDQFFAFGGVLLFFINEQPGDAGDRICLLSWRVDHRETEVVWNLRRGQSFGNRFERRGNKVAGRVLEVGERQFILARISQFDVTDGAGQLLDLTGNAFVALGAKTDRPFDGGVA